MELMERWLFTVRTVIQGDGTHTRQDEGGVGRGINYEIIKFALNGLVRGPNVRTITL